MKQFFFRFSNMMLGLVLYALGIIVTMKANIGYAPWEVFHAGLANVTDLSIGVASIVAGVVIVILVTALGEKLGLGTLGSMILTGVFMDIILWVDLIPAAKSMAVGIPMLIGGLLIISIGSYFYMKSAFGAGPRDNLMVVLARKTKIPVGLCRCIVELLVTLIGWLMGGKVGVGTVVSVVAVGFCIQLTFWALRFDVKAVKHETLRDTYKGMLKKHGECCLIYR